MTSTALPVLVQQNYQLSQLLATYIGSS